VSNNNRKMNRASKTDVIIREIALSESDLYGFSASEPAAAYYKYNFGASEPP